MRIVGCIAAVMIWAAGASADGLALVLGNEDYRNIGDSPRGTEPVEATQPLRQAGFEVLSLANGSTRDTMNLLRDFVARAPAADRLVVVLSGRFVTDGDRSWYLTANTGRPDLLALGQSAVSLESVLQVVSPAQGRAVVFLSHRHDERVVYDAWLSDGIGEINSPQGVMVVRGGPRIVANFMRRRLMRENANLTREVADVDGLTASGYVPRAFEFVVPLATGDTRTRQITQELSASEAAMWSQATRNETIETYQLYLRRYPNGRYAEQARAEITAIQSAPERAARQSEDALSLSRGQRRGVQRDLSFLNFDTRGVDGIFGQGTRRALGNWQRANDLAATGYLTRDHIALLAQQARAAREAVAARDARATAEAARDEDLFWSQTGAANTRDGLRRYLDRYPQGRFAAQARATLEAAGRGRDQAETNDQQAQYQAAEDGLRLNTVTRQLVQLRLADLGMSPGRFDGVLDAQTRIAIRRYQNETDREVTGYLNRQIVLRLIQGN